jgi:SynChlorMet cassette protein ScmC
MNNFKAIPYKKSGYSIRLANDQRWQLIATEGKRSWVEKLTSMMELETCDENGYPKLIFVRKETDKQNRVEPICYLIPGMQDGLPREGWQVHKLPAIRVWYHRDVPDVICEYGHQESHELNILRQSLALHPIFERAQSSGGLPFHAGLVERDGKGILLAASGNSGKSTCCRRLCSPWHPLCDDEALVVRDDLKRYFAHPFPTWSDHLWRNSEQTWDVEKNVLLSAIFFLEKAETDDVRRMGQGEAAVTINQSAEQVCYRFWNNLNNEELRARRKKAFENACELAGSIPTFRLRVSLQGRFWEQIEKVIF